jgi:hypothetical protein
MNFMQRLNKYSGLSVGLHQTLCRGSQFISISNLYKLLDMKVVELIVMSFNS